MAQSWLSNSKYNSQLNRAQTSKGGSSYITRAINNASGMTWGWNPANTTGWDAATLGGNPLSPEFYIPSERWGNAPTTGTSGNGYFGSGFSVNRYVSMADFSTGGDLDTGRYFGAPNISSGVSDFTYRWYMSNEHGHHYGRDTKTTCPKMKLFHSFYPYNYYYFIFL